jgi:gluconate 2-dehydrogenase gamma chain
MATMERQRSSRRKFIRTATAAAGGAAILTACGHPPRRWRFFTEDEAALVSAICQQIIPADDFPGAVEAGVPVFIDRQLAGRLKRHQDAYRSGLVGVQETSGAVFGRKFEALKWDDQTALLKQIEAGKVPAGKWRSPAARTFFGLIRDHTMQGFYGSPRHGGNRDYVSFRMLGVDYPQVIGQNRYK